jgi:hypothetical protein
MNSRNNDFSKAFFQPSVSRERTTEAKTLPTVEFPFAKALYFGNNSETDSQSFWTQHLERAFSEHSFIQKRVLSLYQQLGDPTLAMVGGQLMRLVTQGDDEDPVLTQRHYQSIQALMLSGEGRSLASQTWQNMLSPILDYHRSLPEHDRPTQFRSPKFIRYLELLLELRGQDRISEAQLPHVLTTLTNMNQLFPRLNVRDVQNTLQSCFDPNPSVRPNPEKTMQELYKLCRYYQQRLPEAQQSRDDGSVPLYLFNRLLVNHPQSAWPEMSRDLLDKIAALPDLSVLHHFNHSIKPDATLLDMALKPVLQAGGEVSPSPAERFDRLIAAHTTLQEIQQGQWLDVLERMISLSPNADTDQGYIETIRQVLEKGKRLTGTPLWREVLMAGLPPERVALLTERIGQLEPGNDSQVIHLSANPMLKDLSDENFDALLDRMFVHQDIATYDETIRHLNKFRRMDDDCLNWVCQTVFSQSGHYLEAADAVSEMRKFLPDVLPPRYRDLPEETREQFEMGVALMASVPFPEQFLNTFIQAQDRLSPEILDRLFYWVEFGTRKVAQAMLPELIAVLGPYLQKIQQLPSAQAAREPDYEKPTKEPLHEAYIHRASSGLTRLYGYIEGGAGNRINSLEGIALNNWARIGTLGRSFTKWQYDAMSRWKGMGPGEKSPLLVESQRFEPIPRRESDATYGPGFLYADSKTGLTIELRRAYILIAKPEGGTLVIRNSSPVFGRDLLAEPAYYNAQRFYGPPFPLFDPSDMAGGDFLSVFDKPLNANAYEQREAHTKIEALLEAFDEAMEGYVEWKCGFHDGKAPPGFLPMVTAVLETVRNQGAMSPFRNKKPLKLAWANRYDLPYATTVLDPKDPEIHGEMAYFLSTFGGPGRNYPSLEAHEKRMPHLLAFLREGLTHGLELVITE